MFRIAPNINQFIRTFTCLERPCKTHKKVFWSQEDDLEKISERTIALFEGINVPPDFIREKLQ